MKEKMIKEMRTIEICCYFVTVFGLLPCVWLIISLIQSDVVSSQIAFSVYGISASGVTCLIALIARAVAKEGRPFTKKVATYLDCLQGWVYLISLSPALVSFLQRDGQKIMDALGFRFITIWFIAVAIGIFTRIYRYGCDLQNDMDEIA